MTFSLRPNLLWPILGALALAGAAIVYAQLEGADRGVPPIDSSSTLEVTGVHVDVGGKTGEEARTTGWKLAQALGWRALWAKTTGRPAAEAPSLPESVLDSIVSSIVIEDEQIGPKRYIATLGLLFDRAKTGQMLGLGGPARRSQPMLVIPILETGATSYSFEYRGEWQKAWARFRTGASAVDYVRPVGSGIDPLLLNAAQTGRPGRAQWRHLLDEYGAADVVIPEVRLERSWPGGPAIGIFTARFGPDRRPIAQFTLRADTSTAIPRMFDEGVRRLDEAYAGALAAGALAPDPSLTAVEPAPVEPPESLEPATDVTTALPIAGAATAFALQVDTPNAGSVNAAELAVSRIPGVTSALTTSLALGGTSIMKVTYAGDAAAFAAALKAQGWTVQGSATALRIGRSAAPPSGQ